MKTLELVKRWTGDGYGDAGARIFTQVKRNEKVALYRRTVESTGSYDGHEVFLIKMRHKGDKLPGGMVEAEDREVYPSANSFGRTAWGMGGAAAEAKFQELTDKVNGVVHEPEETPEEDAQENEAPSDAPKHRGRPKREMPTFVLPDGEFSVKELAASNGVEYVVAYQFVKQEEGKTVIPTRSERRAARGKETQLYKKVA
jgi:hypothetical protein